MSNTNTIAGWVLAGGIAALGLSIASGMYFHVEQPEKPGWFVEGGGDHGGAAKEVIPIATLLPTADATKGEAAFKAKCTACHTIVQGGPNGVGPNLWATLGEPVGTGKGGFAFSDALKGVGGNWDFDKMNAWLESPRKLAPGTKMSFGGISDPAERANVIAYMNGQGSNLPLPAAAAAAPSPEEAKVADGASPGNISNESGISANAPSQDPTAKEKAEEAAH